MDDPVVFVSIDGEIARNIEHDSEAREAIRGFKKMLRHVLQRLGFSTLGPTVHTDLVAEAVTEAACGAE